MRASSKCISSRSSPTHWWIGTSPVASWDQHSALQGHNVTHSQPAPALRPPLPPQPWILAHPTSKLVPECDPLDHTASHTRTRPYPLEAVCNRTRVSPACQQVHSSQPSHNRRTQTAHIAGTIRAHSSGEQRDMCDWAPWNISNIRSLLQDWKT